MLNLIKKIFSTPSEQKITVSKNEAKETNIALCVLLLEASHVDGECSHEEKKHVIETLTTQYGIPEEEIVDLIALADKNRKESIDLFQFTRYMNNNFSKLEKIEAMESVWRIIHIDGKLEQHEDHFAHKLANLLRLTHKELIDAKIKARLQLS